MAKKPVSKPNVRTAPLKQPAQTQVKKEQPIKNLFSVRNLCIVLAVLSFVIYANTLANDYVLDDTMVIKENIYVKQGFKGIPDLLTTPHMRGYMVIPNDLYRPLSLVMFAIEYQFFGQNAVVGHFFNIVTFIGCVLMLFFFLIKFFGEQRLAAAFIGAFIFAIHPLHTEVVANIKSRDELLCYFLAFWSLNLFMNYMKSGKMYQLILGSFVFFLSCTSKETVVTLVAIIPLLFFFYDRINTKRAISITVGTAAATIVFLAIRWAILTKFNANQKADVDFIDNALSHAPSAMSRLATEIYIMGKYLLLLIVPYPLLSNYSFRSIPFMTFGSVGVLLSLAAYGGLIYVVITRFMKDKKDPWVFAILFFFATISLFSNFPFLMGAEMAERFTFFATTSVCIAGAVAVEKWLLKEDATNIASLKSTKALAVLIPLLVLFGGMTFARNFDWKNEYTLYKTDLAKSPDDARLYHYLATAIAEKQYPEETDSNKQKAMDQESIDYLQKALEIYPDFTEAHVELGRVYERVRNYIGALHEDTAALRLNPYNATANNNLGGLYLTLGKYRESVPYSLTAIKYNPNFHFSYLNLARAYWKLGVYDSAEIYYKQMLAFDPGYVDASREIALCYFAQQKWDTAAIYFSQVATMTPNDANAINNVGACYLNSKNYPKAIEQFNKALAANPNYMDPYSNLVHAYYYSGQYAQAINMVNKELSVNPKFVKDVPFVALSYQKLGNMTEAKKYEAIAKQIYRDFKLD